MRSSSNTHLWTLECDPPINGNPEWRRMLEQKMTPQLLSNLEQEPAAPEFRWRWRLMTVRARRVSKEAWRPGDRLKVVARRPRRWNLAVIFMVAAASAAALWWALRAPSRQVAAPLRRPADARSGVTTRKPANASPRRAQLPPRHGSPAAPALAPGKARKSGKSKVTGWRRKHIASPRQVKSGTPAVTAAACAPAAMRHRSAAAPTGCGPGRCSCRPCRCHSCRPTRHRARRDPSWGYPRFYRTTPEVIYVPNDYEIEVYEP